jgi:hypothetical protein
LQALTHARPMPEHPIEEGRHAYAASNVRSNSQQGRTRWYNAPFSTCIRNVKKTIIITDDEDNDNNNDNDDDDIDFM